MKEHKMQIIAALALAFSLGMVMPSFTYAEEGDDAEISAQAEGAEEGVEVQAEGATGGGTNKEDVISQNVAENIAELYNNRILKKDSFKGYRDAEDLVSETLIAEENLLQTAQNWAEHVNSSDVAGQTVWVWNALSDTTKAAVADKMIYEAVDTLKADALYNSSAAFKTALDNIGAMATSTATALKTEIKKLMPTVTGVDAMNLSQLVAAAKELPSYGKYVNLYNALETIAFGIDSSSDGVVSVAKLEAAYDEGELMKRYNAIAKAAVAIDETVMEGLMDWELPQTSKPDDKPEAPNTGIVGLLESGALDLGTITLIVSVALASVAGLGLIAKLYLKHKF